MLRHLYSALFYLAMPFVMLRLFWRSRKMPEYRQRIAERFGFCPHQLKDAVWVHAVSVGETLAAIPLIKALKNAYPQLPILVTNMTATGAARVKSALGESVLQAYIPYDLPDAVNRFLARIQPKIAIILETEIWPNLFAACKQRSIPLIITNARLSEKSAQGYHHIAAVTREMLSAVSMLASQGKADAERFIDLGLPIEKITVTGNLKYDLEIPQDITSKSEILRQQLGKDRPIWIAASTHGGEEEILLAAHRRIRAKFTDALLILVPRHPDRFDQVAASIEQQGFRVVRRSQGTPCSSDVEVYLSDTMGEMLLLYSAVDVTFVAGSFVQVGGHNVLEPAALNKPVLSGPILFNFAEISQKLLEANGLIIVNNADELAHAVEQLFSDAPYRQQIGNNARKVVDENRGALQKQMRCIESLMNL
jgi:3-deoxy-D-manno-octulosonic-acid transferase